MSFGKGLKTFRGRTRNRYNQDKEYDNGIRYGEKLRQEENQKTQKEKSQQKT
jgi:Sec-independent protein translocase protein TatA